MEEEKHPLQVALEQLTNDGTIEGSVRSYSGRGMYGKKCLSITGNDLNILSIGFTVGREYEDVEEYEFTNYRQDSMGLGTVVYWPRIPFVEEFEEIGLDDDD